MDNSHAIGAITGTSCNRHGIGPIADIAFNRGGIEPTTIIPSNRQPTCHHRRHTIGPTTDMKSDRWHWTDNRHPCHSITIRLSVSVVGPVPCRLSVQYCVGCRSNGMSAVGSSRFNGMAVVACRLSVRWYDGRFNTTSVECDVGYRSNAMSVA